MPPRKKSTVKKTETKDKSLAISKQEKQVLSKQQKSFNRLVKKVEKLQKELSETNQKLTKNLEVYGKEIHPLELESVEKRKEVIKLLYPFLKDKKALKAKDRKILADIISGQLHDVLHISENRQDPELMDIFKAVEGMTIEEAEQESMEDMKNKLSQMFEFMGFKMNLDDLHADMSDEEMAREMLKMQEQFEQQAGKNGSQQKARKKTKKQLEKEEREKQAEELKSKSIGRIYKQLAKVLHPDLEKDPEQKKRKELLMQELTTAYKNNDLHKLLRLELEWIHQQEANLEQLTDEKLSIYNDVLKEQVKELEMDFEMLLQHPRWEPLQRYSFLPVMMRSINFKHIKKDMKEIMETLDDSIENLKGKGALKEIKALVKMHSEADEW